MVYVDSTEAKEIALHYMKSVAIRQNVDARYTPAQYGKTTNQAKKILESGYTKKEIIDTIDYLLDVMKVDMYSLGYVSSAINDVLITLKRIENSKKASIEVAKIENTICDEVDENVESRKRNRNKLEGFGTKSRYGEELNFNLHEG